MGSSNAASQGLGEAVAAPASSHLAVLLRNVSPSTDQYHYVDERGVIVFSVSAALLRSAPKGTFPSHLWFRRKGAGGSGSLVRQSREPHRLREPLPMSEGRPGDAGDDASRVAAGRGGIPASLRQL